jgi:hypothetical protein
MNRRNFFTWIAAAIGWLLGWRATETLGFVRPAAIDGCGENASALAWRFAVDGYLRTPTCPRCEVFVDGQHVPEAVEANCYDGWVDVLRLDQFDPSIHEDIPRSRVHGFIDIKLKGDGLWRKGDGRAH